MKGNRSLASRLLLTFAVLLALLGSGRANAQIKITQVYAIPLSTTDWTQSFTIDKFDPSLGVLTGVKLTFHGEIQTSFTLENLAAKVNTATCISTGSITLTRPDSSTMQAVIPSQTVTQALPPFDGVIDLGGTDTVVVPPVDATQDVTYSIPPPAGDLALFQGSGKLVLPVVAHAFSSVTENNGNAVSLIRTKAAAGLSVDYVYVPYVTVEGNVWTPVKPGTAVSGVQITLTGNDFNGNPVSLSTTTNASGHYSFTNLAPSDGSGYTVTETVPTNYSAVNSYPGLGGSQVSTTVLKVLAVTGGTDYTPEDFAIDKLRVSIAGNVWTPAQTTGTKVPGVTITLTGTDIFGNAIPVGTTATTDASGHYSFTGLPLSNAAGYTVTETVLPGYYAVGSYPANSATDTSLSPTAIKVVAQTGGTTYQPEDFAIAQADVTISGTVWTPVRGITPVAGVTITLTGNTAAGAPVKLTTTTDASGNYLFAQLDATHLLPVSDATGYKIDETVIPAGTIPVDSYVGTLPTTKNGAQELLVKATTSGSYVHEDFAIDAHNVTIAGNVWTPNQGPAANVSPVGNVTITLTGKDMFGQTVNLSIQTVNVHGTPDTYGHYVFANINPSDANGYTITETVPAGYFAVGSYPANKTTDTGVSSTVINVVAQVPGVYQQEDFAIDKVLVNIYGKVWTPAQGVTPVGGVTITLTGTDVFTQAVSTSTTTASGNGTYSFTGLNLSSAAGYTITETVPAGWSAVNSYPGDSAVRGTTNPKTVLVVTTVPAVQDYHNEDFAIDTGRVAVEGTVWTPVQGPKAGVAPVAGVTVSLTGNDLVGRPVSLTQQTGSTGQYSFPGLYPSDSNGYTVAEIAIPAVYDYVDAYPGDAATKLSVSSLSVLAKTPGTTYMTEDFALKLINTGGNNGSIAGTVYRDCNANGKLDTGNGNGETGLAGWPVTLIDSSGNAIATTQTASDGTYSFTGLAVGSYKVVVSQLADYKETWESPETPVVLDSTQTVPVAAQQNVTNINFGYTGTAPAVQIVKTGPTTAHVGDKITYHIKVTNTGNTCLYGGITVYDALVSPCGDHAIWHKTPVLPGEVNEFDVTYTVPCNAPASLVNTASAVGCPPGTLAKVTDTDSWTTQIISASKGSISGRVWCDKDCDCQYDSGEALGGAVVALYVKSGSSWTKQGQTTTDSKGSYKFANLPAGTYQVLLDPTGYSVSGSNPVSVSLASGQQKTVNFILKGASVKGTVYWDKDTSRSYNCGDRPISGVCVKLKDTSGNVLATATTDCRGNYVLGGCLAAGNYKVEVPSTICNGTVDTADPVAVTLTAGQCKSGVNFGYKCKTHCGR